MQHFWSLDEVQVTDTWLTIGSFDGVHLGHQSVVSKLVAGAHTIGAPAVVLTFYPHPSIVLRGYNYPFYLTTPNEKARLLGESGVDVIITHPFNKQVANTTAAEFMHGLHQHLNILHLYVGYDFALGKDRQGDIATLKDLGEKYDYTVEQMEPLIIDGDTVSSSRIRFLLGAGQVDKAAELLGRNFTIEGKVELGDRRGILLGFPTANLDIWPAQAIPAAGVYVCRAEVRGKKWGAVTNIGVRPTFEFQPVPPRVETHILDFDQDIYGENLRLEFITRLRGEQRFADVDALKEQINKDSQAAREMLASVNAK
jgi:riboflavin kinase/FMN adenylyltransferase